MRTRPLTALLALLLLLAPLHAAAQQTAPAGQPRDPERHLLRGDVFYLEGDYYRAITEYQYFLQETAAASPASAEQTRGRVELKIAWIYNLAQKPDASAAILERLSAAMPDRSEGRWARLYLAKVSMSDEEPLKARRLLEGLVDECDPLLEGLDPSGMERPPADPHVRDCLQLSAYAHLGLARYHARVHQFDRAAQELRAVPEPAAQDAEAASVAAYLAGLEIPSKSPALAGSLSIVPGLGHFYLEEWTVGTVALLWNGLFAYATVDSILSENYGQAALLGMLELVWYSGTIYGAVAGAHRFNRDAKRIVEDGLTDDIDRLDVDTPWPARFPVEYPVGLTLEF